MNRSKSVEVKKEIAGKVIIKKGNTERKKIAICIKQLFIQKAMKL